MEYIIGIGISLLVQWLKKYSLNEWTTMGFVLAISLVAASLYTALTALGYWSAVASILVTAGAFYAFVLQRFEA